MRVYKKFNMIWSLWVRKGKINSDERSQSTLGKQSRCLEILEIKRLIWYQNKSESSKRFKALPSLRDFKNWIWVFTEYPAISVNFLKSKSSMKLGYDNCRVLENLQITLNSWNREIGLISDECGQRAFCNLKTSGLQSMSPGNSHGWRLTNLLQANDFD